MSQMGVARNDGSVIGRWWWTVDRWIIIGCLVLASVGVLMALAASPEVANRINRVDEFALARRHITLLPIAVILAFTASLMPLVFLRRLAIVGFLGSLVLLVMVLFVGHEIKGASRWISIAGFSLQPSEFAKPCFAVASAWMMATWVRYREFPGLLFTTVGFVLTIVLLLAEPDVGQAMVMSAIFISQLFMLGLPIWLFFVLGLGAAGMLLFAYYTMGHVRSRIDGFLFQSGSNDGYQIERSLESFRDGGWFGKGPGEGQIKSHLPDAHADFVFAVIGEEFGLIACFLVLAIIATMVLRVLFYNMRERDLFVVVASVGLVSQLALQSLINMATALHIIPTKGMTLPFVSYGGSSLLATGLGVGFLLALTRRSAANGRDH